MMAPYTRRTLVAAAACWAASLLTAPAVQLRICAFNVQLGLGAPGTAGYNAARDTLRRISPDVISLEEITTDDTAGAATNVAALATELGYPSVYIPSLTSLDFSTRTVILSRYPFLSTTAISSAEGANEVVRRFPAVKLDVPGTPADPTFIGVHLKCCLDADDPFRRAVELRRIREHLVTAGLTGADNLIIAGDFNLVGSDRTISSLPTTLPSSYRAGADITYPFQYFIAPASYFPATGMVRQDCRQLNGSSTTQGSSSVLDHILVTPALNSRPHGVEIYNSIRDTSNTTGLEKAGNPPAASTSATASDHYALFGDFELDDNPYVSLTLSQPSAPENTPPGTVTLTVSLPAPLPAGPNLTVTLTTSDPAEATVSPSTVVFSPGQSSRVVNVTTITDNVSDGEKPVTFSASAAGYATGTASFTVIDSDFPAYLLTAAGQPVREMFSGFAGTAAPDKWITAGAAWLGADDGTQSATGFRSYGAPADGSLGILLPSSGPATAAATLKNVTGSTIHALQIDLTAEQWRSAAGGNASTLTAELILNGTPQPVSGLAFTAATNLPSGPLTNVKSPHSVILTGLEIAPADYFELRLTIAPGPGGGSAPDGVFINEFHYDNASNDEGEFFEIAVGPGYSGALADISLILYNGSGGGTYDTPHTLDTFTAGTVTASGHRLFSKLIPGIQNGAPDGFAVVSGSTVIQFLSYEGTFAATNGPASGMTSIDIGVNQPGTVAAGSGSLGLTGTGGAAADFTWLRFPGLFTAGEANAGQTFTAAGGSQGIAIDDLAFTVLLDSDGDGIPDITDPDDDNDGLPDTLESTLGTNPLLADSDGDGTPDGEEDGDGDGLANYFEAILAGTDPLDPASAFRLTTNSAPGGPQVTFPTRTGRSYQLESTPDLTSWTILSTQPGTGADLTLPLPSLPAGTRAFFRVRILIP